MKKLLTLDIISERIANKVLETRIISKVELLKKIRCILSIWHQEVNVQNRNRRSKGNNLERLDKHIDRIEFEKKFWRNKTKELISTDELDLLYKELGKLKISNKL